VNFLSASDGSECSDSQHRGNFVKFNHGISFKESNAAVLRASCRTPAALGTKSVGIIVPQPMALKQGKHPADTSLFDVDQRHSRHRATL
jgi:hypothetical protein